jgi:hypothetical protein
MGIEHLQQADHVCAIYSSGDDQVRLVGDYMRIGIDGGERCLYIVDDRTFDDVRGTLASAGIDIGAAVAARRLVLMTKRDSYLERGRFDPDAMIWALSAITDEAISDGCTGLRVTGEMTWALGPEIGCDRLIDYERKLNEFFDTSRAHAICQYNLSRFPAATIRDVLRTHPLAVIADKVCPNFYYEPPDVISLPETDPRRLAYMLDNLTSDKRWQ